LELHGDAQEQVDSPQVSWVGMAVPVHVTVVFVLVLVLVEQFPFFVHPWLCGLLLQQTSVRPSSP